MSSGPDSSPFSPSAWGQLIAQVGFPVVAALALAWIVWVLTQRVTGIETKLRNDSVLFGKMEASQEQGKKELAEIDVTLAQHEHEMSKDIDALKADHGIVLRRIDDMYRVMNMPSPHATPSQQYSRADRRQNP